MNDILQIFVPALIAFCCTCWIHPYILKVAKLKNIVDNPDARKLQRRPVPVLGGLTVGFGVLAGLMGFSLFGDFAEMFPVLAAIVIIMIVGLMDDVISLSSWVRVVVEVILVLYLMFATDSRIDNLYGLWGVHHLPDYVSMPLTVVACVGIINAINLIDGVDGISAGYTIVSSILFGVMFYALGNLRMVALAAVVVASLLPFLLHNVFGKHSKMFIGDAGALSLGVVFSVFVITMLSGGESQVEIGAKLGLVPFTLAVLCVPVFDTLRVMCTRMLSGKSPFCPDKTHLHHLFIEVGYSHIGTTLSIIGINLFVVLCWYLAYRLGLSVDVQLWVVVVLGVCVTFVFYPVAKRHIRKQTRFYQLFNRIASRTHLERKGLWLFAQELADKSTSKEMRES